MFVKTSPNLKQDAAKAYNDLQYNMCIEHSKEQMKRISSIVT